MSVTKSIFGKTSDGNEVTLFSIENKNGMKVDVIDYGAVIVRLFTADRDGKLEDIVLGFDDVASYEVNGCFFGAFIGRHGNRIGDAKFTLNGETYQLEKNDGKNNLHGGTPGYHKVMYAAKVEDNAVTFSRVSPDMEQGYPGNLELNVRYELTDDNELKITYSGCSDKDTLCNLTNHSYFNLKGHNGGMITDHEIMIKANQITLTSDDLIPDGSMEDVEGTPMDFREKKVIGDGIEADYKPIKIAGGYDHNFALDKPIGAMEKVCEVSEKSTGRVVEVFTDLPGMQFYTGNFIDKENGKEGAVYTKRTGLCLETQYFPNSVNVPSFESCVIKAGEKFQTTTTYRFSAK
ncbi:aldose epimerase family protein [Eubacterium xylanophilum]|uniref:aldose epimerase family protein n=1 Tax=Eubacterium xylanophilum TaxID=39497 RepID=UPI00047983D6|nr:aldose epimerase family protein [Eubacterium xylanophilum]